MAKSVVVHYHLEVVDLDEEADKRIHRAWKENIAEYPDNIPELPGVNLNIARLYHYPSGVAAMADRLVTISAIAIMDSEKEKGEPVPYCIILNPVDIND